MDTLILIVMLYIFMCNIIIFKAEYFKALLFFKFNVHIFKDFNLFKLF